MRRCVLFVVVLLAWLCAGASPGLAEKMYFCTATGEIWRANLDGSQLESLVAADGGFHDIALDVGAGRMYWTDGLFDRIARANLDGSDIETVVTGLRGVEGIALDLARSKMYWTDAWADKIQRARLDGTEVEDLPIWDVGDPNGIALDLVHGTLYWACGLVSEGRVRRATLDGYASRDVVGGLSVPFGVALDLVGQKIYWSDYVGFGRPGTIQRANLDGTGVETVLSGLSEPRGIALDLDRGKIYWVSQYPGGIWRANLDGTSTEAVISGIASPQAVALDLRVIPEPTTLVLVATVAAILAAGACARARFGRNTSPSNTFNSRRTIS